MGLLDKLANAGVRSRMSDELLGLYKGAAKTMNAWNDLAYVAANPGAARVARKAARAQLAAEVGEREADELIKQATRKLKDSF